jgi:hypothetical protein
MTTLYLDSTLGAAITDGGYSIANRDNSGSDGNAYLTLAAAWAACSNGDTIYLREGGETLSAQLTLATKTGITIALYEQETYTITQGADLNALGFYSDTTVALGNGMLIIRGTPEAIVGTNRVALFLQTAGFSVTARSGKIVLDWPKVAIQTNSLQTYVIANPVFVGCNPTTRCGQDGTTITLRNPVCVGTAFNHALGDITLNANNLTLVGANPRFLQLAPATTTINNILAVGLGELSDVAIPYYSYGGTVTINGGVVHSGVRNDDRTPGGAGAGGVTETGVDDSAFVRFQSQSNHKCYVTFYALESSSADASNGKLAKLKAALETYGQKGSFAPDDTHQLDSGYSGYNVAFHVGAQAWVNAGHEFCLVGSGGDSWAIEQPFVITYTGARTDVKLVISAAGTVWEIKDGETVLGTFDCSLGGTHERLGVYQALSNIDGGNVLRGIELLTGGGDTFVVTDNGGAGGFDDAWAGMMEDGTYALASGSPINPIPSINFARRAQFEIDIPKAVVFGALGVTPTIYANTPVGGYSADLSNYVEADGFAGCIQWNGPSGNPIYSLDPYSLGVGLTTTSFYNGMGGESATESQIRAYARRIASYGFSKSAYIPLQVIDTNNGGTITQEQYEWFISELLACGVEIVTFAQAVDLIGTAEPVVTYDYTLADCGAVGQGYKWRTGPRPAGASGEPFSDIDTDPGSSQSTHGPFHPTNL